MEATSHPPLCEAKGMRVTACRTMFRGINIVGSHAKVKRGMTFSAVTSQSIREICDAWALAAMRFSAMRSAGAQMSIASTARLSSALKHFLPALKEHDFAVVADVSRLDWIVPPGLEEQAMSERTCRPGD